MRKMPLPFALSGSSGISVSLIPGMRAGRDVVLSLRKALEKLK
jgi:hypothetical protein